MCPDSVLLVAYLDRTLFSRDAVAIDQHLASCERCTALLADMRQQRAAAAANPPGRWKRFAIPVAITVVVAAAVGAWVLMAGTSETPAGAPSIRDTTSDRSDVAPAPAPDPATTPITAPPTPAAPSRSPAPVISHPERDIPKPKVVPLTRSVRPLVQWRTHDLVVERSTDGGETWTIEHTADRPIRAAAFVDADVAWIVGESGLILRRTKNGWFGATPPAEGHLVAVRASSPSKATVTIEDGRVFTTANGGVTWSSP